MGPLVLATGPEDSCFGEDKEFLHTALMLCEHKQLPYFTVKLS